MNILLLAPQPFYQERGSPIAVDRLLAVLAARGERVDVVTYHEGSDVAYPGMALFRIPALPRVRGIRPGFSWKKLLCDLLLLVKVFELLLWRRYHLVHAVEESVFIALLLKVLCGLPYVYDMDSSLAEQLVARHRALRPLTPLLHFWEGLAVRHALAVVPVCPALARTIQCYQPQNVIVLPDVSLLVKSDSPSVENFRHGLGIEGALLMYVGNLEGYQGIELLLESFALAARQEPASHLVVIGGAAADVQHYQQRAVALGLAGRAHLLGPRPVEQLAGCLAQADVLISPRVQGSNTPMKVYSYLDSGGALLATALETHTQLLDERVALLAEPEPEPFARAMLQLIADPLLRGQLGAAGRALVQSRFSPDAFTTRANALFDWLQREVVLRSATPIEPRLAAPTEQ